MGKIKQEKSDDLESVYSAESDETLAKLNGTDLSFQRKVRVLNAAINEAGFGRYQIQLFFSAGFGWFVDNLWLQSIAILLPSINNQFNNPHPRLITLSLYAGLIVGAFFWGMSADVIGRRLAFNCTLFVGGVFGVAAGAAPNFAVLGVLIAFLGFGVGGNLPIDGALFLEFFPATHPYLLTLLSLWWAVGQVVGSLVSWVFVANFSCDGALTGTANCNDSNNQGWRYPFYTLGSMTLFFALLRGFVLPMDESPKFLLARGRDTDAVAVVHRIAKRNKTTSTLTVEKLRSAAMESGDDPNVNSKFSTWDLVKHSFDDFKGEHVRALFSTRLLAYSTSLIIIIYGALGLAYPLYNGFLGLYLSSRNATFGNTSVNATFSTYTYQAACGVPGSILAAVLVLGRFGGRKSAMAFFTIASGIFLFALTAARTPAQINGLTCAASFMENAFYGVLYAYAPEVFPTPHRGTGDALASAASRVTGIFAPVIAEFSPAARTPNGPVYTSAAIFVATGLLMLALPFEPAKRAAS